MSTGMPWMPIWNVMMPLLGHLDLSAVPAHAGAGHVQDGGEGAVALRLAEDAVDARQVRALDRDVLQADVEAVRLRRADRGPRRQLRVDRHLRERLLLRVPERVEVGGLGHGRLDLVGRVAGGREAAVLLALDLRGRDEAQEAGLARGPSPSRPGRPRGPGPSSPRSASSSRGRACRTPTRRGSRGRRASPPRGTTRARRARRSSPRGRA